MSDIEYVFLSSHIVQERNSEQNLTFLCNLFHVSLKVPGMYTQQTFCKQVGVIAWHASE